MRAGSKIEIQTDDYKTGNTRGNSVVEIDYISSTMDGIQQTVMISDAGTYQMSFDYSVRYKAGVPGYVSLHSNAIEVLVDGKVVQRVMNGHGEKAYSNVETWTLDLDLSAGRHTITFREVAYHDFAKDGMGGILDNVSLRKVDMVYETGEVSGTFYYDGDQDGQQDASEGGLGGRTVYLLNEDKSYVRDADGDVVTTTTDPDGDYTFKGVEPGNYRVGFANTADSERDGPRQCPQP